MLTKTSIFYDSGENEVGLPFYRSFSTFSNIYLALFPLKIFIHRHWVKGDLKSFVA